MTDKLEPFRQNVFSPIDFALRPDIFTDEERTSLAEWEGSALYHGGVPDGQLDIVEVSSLARDLKFISNQTLAGALKKIEKIYEERASWYSAPGFEYACIGEGACITFDLTADVKSFIDRFEAKHPDVKIEGNPRGKSGVDGIVMMHKNGAIMLLPFQEPVEKAEPVFSQPVYDNDDLGDYRQMHDASLQAGDEVWPESLKWWGVDWTEDEELVWRAEWAYPQFEAAFIEDLLSVENRFDKASLEGARKTLYQIIDEHIVNREDGAAGLAKVVSHFKNPTQAAMVYAYLKYQAAEWDHRDTNNASEAISRNHYLAAPSEFINEIRKIDPVFSQKIEWVAANVDLVAFDWSFLETDGIKKIRDAHEIIMGENMTAFGVEETSPENDIPEGYSKYELVKKNLDQTAGQFLGKNFSKIVDYAIEKFGYIPSQITNPIIEQSRERLAKFVNDYNYMTLLSFINSEWNKVQEFTEFNEDNIISAQESLRLINTAIRYMVLNDMSINSISHDILKAAIHVNTLSNNISWNSQNNYVPILRSDASTPVTMMEPPNIVALHAISQYQVITVDGKLRFEINTAEEVAPSGFDPLWRIYNTTNGDKDLNIDEEYSPKPGIFPTYRVVALPAGLDSRFVKSVATITDDKSTSGMKVKIERELSRINYKNSISITATPPDFKPNERNCKIEIFLEDTPRVHYNTPLADNYYFATFAYNDSNSKYEFEYSNNSFRISSRGSRLLDLPLIRTTREEAITSENGIIINNELYRVEPENIDELVWILHVMTLYIRVPPLDVIAVTTGN